MASGACKLPCPHQSAYEGIHAERERSYRSTGSFLPDLTKSAVDCALLHRVAGQRLLAETSQDFVSILRDDDDALDEFGTKLEQHQRKMYFFGCILAACVDPYVHSHLKIADRADAKCWVFVKNP